MKKAPSSIDHVDPRGAYDRALEKRRDDYRVLRHRAATLVYLRIKLEAEHFDETGELSRAQAEAEAAKAALIALGREIRALERERLRAIALGGAGHRRPTDEPALEKARDEIERRAALVELDRELHGD